MASVLSMFLVLGLAGSPVVYSGRASYYGSEFEGRRTASGERYHGQEFTAAHRSLPFGTHVRVTRIDTGDSVVVRITDRGPFVRGRIIDLSRVAAMALDMIPRGVISVRVEVIPVSEDAVSALMERVTELIGSLPEDDETVPIRHVALPIGTEGWMEMAPSAIGVETRVVPFRVVERARGPEHVIWTGLRARRESSRRESSRRASTNEHIRVRLTPFSPPLEFSVEASSPIENRSPISYPAPSTPGEPVFPTPILVYPTSLSPESAP